MILKKIFEDETFNISDFNLSKLSDKEWNKISDQKFTYILNNKKSNILYPGFCFSNDEAANYFSTNILNFIINELKAFTSPRGNLSKNNNTIVIGQRPGHAFAHLSKSESAWLLGPSSKMLCRLLSSCNIYPYFTNFYHSHYVKIDLNYSNIIIEILKIFKLYSKFYNINEFKIIFLGRYDEYDILKKELSKLNTVKINFINIWHPAYILRNNSEENYNNWLNDLKNKL